MTSRTGAFVASNPLGVNIKLTLGSPDLFGLIEATSNAGNLVLVLPACDSARVGVAFSNPNRMGAATAINPAALSNSFLLRSKLLATRSVMIRRIRFLRSAPVTPETQASGEATQNSQVFKMLSA